MSPAERRADRPREPRQRGAHDHRELLPRRSAARRGGPAAAGPRLARDRGGAQVEAPIVFVSAHFGNWQAARAALNQRGYDIGGLYRPFNNPYVNAHYVESIERVGGRAYARSRHGIAAFLRTLRAGGQAAMMLDQYVADGESSISWAIPRPPRCRRRRWRSSTTRSWCRSTGCGWRRVRVRDADRGADPAQRSRDHDPGAQRQPRRR
jgi:hypothetical protein